LGQAARHVHDDPRSLNALAWFLAACPDAAIRDPSRAVELARRATELAPKNGSLWNTLGVARYRVGDWRGAIEALEKAMELRHGGDASDWLFLAMAHWRLGAKDQARGWYERAAAEIATNRTIDEELARFRDEAADLIRSADADAIMPNGPAAFAR
jgi:Flp pilus assembly protein TadD